MAEYDDANVDVSNASSCDTVVIFSMDDVDTSVYNPWLSYSSSSSLKIQNPIFSSSLIPLSFFQPPIYSSSSVNFEYNGNGSCFPTVDGEEVSSINVGNSVVWKYALDLDAPVAVILAARKAPFTWEILLESQHDTIVMRYGQKTDEIVYDASGRVDASVSFDFLGPAKKIDCKSLEVRDTL